MPRIMIINWKFNNGKTATNTCKTYDVNDSNNDKLICCNYDDINKFNGILENYDDNGNEMLIMLHKNKPNENIKSKNINAFKKAVCKVCEFRKGSGPIYCSGDYPKGILGAGVKLDNSALKQNKIKKEHFDFVWEYYWKLCKKKLYELKEDLLFCLYPLSFQEKTEFKEYLGTEMLLNIRIKDLLGEEELSDNEKSKIKKLENNNNNYYSFSDCHNSYQEKDSDSFNNLKNTLKLIPNAKHNELFNLIENKFTHIFPNPDIKTIPEFVRYQFDKLLNTMNEPIY